MNVGDSGDEICRKMRKVFGSTPIPIVMCTAMTAGSAALESCKEAGATDYLLKPYERAKMIEKVEQYCRDKVSRPRLSYALAYINSRLKEPCCFAQVRSLPVIGCGLQLGVCRSRRQSPQERSQRSHRRHPTPAHSQQPPQPARSPQTAFCSSALVWTWNTADRYAVCTP